jgi:hypothetical protein
MLININEGPAPPREFHKKLQAKKLPVRLSSHRRLSISKSPENIQNNKEGE